jgi:hypothetical protein
MTTKLEENKAEWRNRVSALILSGFQIAAEDRETFRASHLDTLNDADLMLLGGAINDLWNVRGIRSTYLKNAVAAGRVPHAIHTLNILFNPFRGNGSPILAILSMRGLSQYGILSEDGYEIVDHSRVGEALALMNVVMELNSVDDHDLWVGRSATGGIYINDEKLLELVKSRSYPVYRITSAMAGHGTGNVDILLPVLASTTADKPITA